MKGPGEGATDPESSRWRVLEHEARRRVDRVVADRLGIGVREAGSLCAEGRVKRAGRPLAKGAEVMAGDELVVRYHAPQWFSGKNPPRLNAIFTDARCVIVDKPAGMPTHPMSPGEGGTAADGLVALYPEAAAASVNPREGGACHRLDTDTSGLLVFARSRDAWHQLHDAFVNGDAQRTYFALVHGALRSAVVLHHPIAHHPRDKTKMVVVSDDTVSARGSPRAASSHVEPIAFGADVTWVRVRTEGGRRHQVRVHLAEAGFPLVGDKIYGGAPHPARDGHLLHACRLRLEGAFDVSSPLPTDFQGALRDHGISPLQDV